jgi:hypothetical protein
MGRDGFTTMFVAGILVFGAKSTGAQEPPDVHQHLVVRWYSPLDSSNDSTSVWRLASDILGHAGIRISWRACTPDGTRQTAVASECAEALGQAEIVVRVVPQAPENPGSRGVLGFSYIDPRERRGTLATIYADRVAALAHSANVDVAELMARAVAHEIGHVLLGTTQHAGRGLMRAEWSAIELHRDAPLDWRFSNEEARRMKNGVAERTAGAAHAYTKMN